MLPMCAESPVDAEALRRCKCVGVLPGSAYAMFLYFDGDNQLVADDDIPEALKSLSGLIATGEFLDGGDSTVAGATTHFWDNVARE